MGSMLKSLTHGAVACMLVSAAAAQSSSRCTISASGFSNSKSEAVGVAVAVGADVSAYVCADPKVLTVESSALSVATEVATATATAIAGVYAQCAAQGRASFTVNGRSLAQAEAVAVAKSFAEGLIEASVCDFCDVAADFVADSFEKIIVQATALAEVELVGTTNKARIEAGAAVFAERIVSASATAFAKVLVEAKADVDGGCSGRIVGVVGGKKDTCTVEVSAKDKSIVQNADTEIIADVIAESCKAGEDVVVTIDATATAVATAMARAVAEISSSCIIQGQTTACVVSEANVKATAEAVASAFGFAIVDARSTCNPPLCELSSEVLVEAFETILAEAATEALFAQCVGKGDTFNVKVLSEQIVTATATSLTQILAQASVVGGKCDFSLDTLAGVTIGKPATKNIKKTIPQPAPKPAPKPAKKPAPKSAKKPAKKPARKSKKPAKKSKKKSKKPAKESKKSKKPSKKPSKKSKLPKCGGKCAGNNRQCDGTTLKAPKACCDPKFKCVRRNSRFSQCRRNGKPGSKSWDGTIVRCKA